MAEGTDRPVGERRRRREAERAAALAAEAAGESRPLTRRELRRLEAEEAARLEAIATGELRVDDVQTAYDAHVAATTAGADPSAASTGEDPGGVTTTAHSAPSGPSAGGDAGAVTTTADSAPSGPSAGGDAGAVTTTADSAPSAASDRARTGGFAPSAGAPASGILSRRSLRERVKDAEPAPPERPQERTATGRRPVVRTPSTAQGVRSLDSTGQLTGIQPVVRPDAADRPGQPTDREPAEVDGPAHASNTVLPPTDAPAGPSESEDGADDESHVPLRPEWVAISSISGATPDEARSELSARGTRREQAAPDAEPGTEPGNPAVTVVKVGVLILVVAVIGALVWLLGTGALDDDGATGATAAPTLIITAPHPEETSAR